MEKQQITTYKRVYSTENKVASLDKMGLFFGVLGFLLGRAVLIDTLGPFGISYFAYMCKLKRYKVPVFFFISLGIMFSHQGSNALRYIISLFIMYLISSNINLEKKKVFNIALFGFIINMLVSITFSIVKGIYIYDVLISLFESLVVFALVYIYSFGIELILKKSIRRVVSNEEIIALSIIMGIAVSGFSNVNFFNISLKSVLSMLMILIFAYKGGAALGASTGITIGLITNINNLTSTFYIALYGFCGLIGGVFNKINKYMVVFSFSLAASIMMIYTKGIGEIILIREVVIASLLFLLISEEKLEYLEKFTKAALGNEESAANYVKRVKEILNNRLREVESAYSEIANTFEKVREKERILDQRDIASVVDMISQDVCVNCGMKRSCWNTKFHHTYSMIMEILNILESEGKINESLAPDEFKRYCIKSDSILKSAKHYFDLFMLDYKWNKKLSENRKLVSSQIKSLSKCVGNLAKELKEDINFDVDMENEIIVELDKEGIKVDKVSYIKRENKSFEINIQKSPCYGGTLCKERLIPIVSKVVGKKLSSLSLGCKMSGDKCNIKLVEGQEYIAKTQVCFISKDESAISGDSYTYMELEDGKYMVALSDGMGKGEKAYEESSVTIQVLEKMMESKIDEKVSIDVVNSMLMLKSSDEIFSTVDLSIIDLKEGMLQTVKMGACPSFIKRSKGSVEVISSSSLPIGIISEVKVDTDTRRVREGDFIIMVSDGIIDAGKDKDLGENWLYTVLEKIEKTSPKEIANIILDKALDLLDNQPIDDMTVVVTKILKNSNI
ncbi:stage II sporulation protein E [Alkalithermobacter thermoalcaliphilus JW-YL-7 = DSM 7308]|uniref:Stage II sporulation protein E n=1 Tax=Alkalithermobacter thermoalcaliphilus JW-YL-7 = DSM 7308 TaxID=1121328 RepID=A0A150FSI5_CLOPD|nr:stage II sporulation protein E, protein serine/threonine phosphatase [[Clostridium] paradoxum JW-YL-7 = DSM 7308]SHK69596.1 stage II sporulation protein E [[Clostridium] paradoxum JW-YL-7 = DSM 7308]